MGEHATAVQARLRELLAERRPDREWHTEYSVAGTPVDVAGTPTDVAETPTDMAGTPTDAADTDADSLVLVELEWRRADPADNTAKLFRHLADGRFETRVVVCQIFTGYYDLTTGGVSSKRENAEFVGRAAARAFDRMTYHPVELPLDPPKRGGDLPGSWESATATAAEAVAATLDE